MFAMKPRNKKLLLILNSLVLMSCNSGANLSNMALQSENGTPSLQFETLEHYDAASQVKLHDCNGIESQFNGNKCLVLKLPVISLSYADMVRLSGDYIGNPDPGRNIGQQADLAQREANFMVNFDAYNNSTYQTYLIKYLTKIRSMDERNKFNKQNQRPLEISDKDNCDFNEISGGICVGNIPVSLGVYLQLANNSNDHFDNNAIQSYLAGHGLALKTAYAGNLTLAYAYEGFAAHFGSDSFAAGHTRTQKQQIQDRCQNEVEGRKFGGLLVKEAHDFSNKTGITLINNNGKQWVALGDAYFFTSGNSQNKQLLIETLQTGVDQIYDIYQKRALISVTEFSKLSQENLKIMQGMLPNPDLTRNLTVNPPAIFSLQDGVLWWRDLRYNKNEPVSSCINAASFYHL